MTPFERHQLRLQLKKKQMEYIQPMFVTSEETDLISNS